MRYKEKERERELEIELEELKKELEPTPQVRELVAHMERIPVLYHEVLLHFQRFKLDNKELVETSMAQESQDQSSTPKKRHRKR